MLQFPGFPLFWNFLTIQPFILADLNLWWTSLVVRCCLKSQIFPFLKPASFKRIMFFCFDQNSFFQISAHCWSKYIFPIKRSFCHRQETTVAIGIWNQWIVSQNDYAHLGLIPTIGCQDSFTQQPHSFPSSYVYPVQSPECPHHTVNSKNMYCIMRLKE